MGARRAGGVGSGRETKVGSMFFRVSVGVGGRLVWGAGFKVVRNVFFCCSVQARRCGERKC